MSTILIPLPRYGFDPTEVSIPYESWKKVGHRIIFATPNGEPGQADIRILTGQGLGLFKKLLMADSKSVASYARMSKTFEFNAPISYAQIRVSSFDALYLPGGHDRGIREYLESEVLQAKVAEFFHAQKLVGAICHGTILVGRSKSLLTGRSVLWGKKTTGLTKTQELTAFSLTCMYLGNYYRTYPKITVEDELKSYLRSPKDFFRGPGFPLPTQRDSAENIKLGFTVRDQNYLSARWPGDAHRLSKDFLDLLSGNSPE